MHLNPFNLERWFANYEFNVGNNLAASCAQSTNTSELLNYGGDSATKEYLSLCLDYIPSVGTEMLRSAITGWYDNINSKQLIVTTGASEAIWLIMNSLLNPGDEVVVETPVYQSLFEVAGAIGACVVPWELSAGNNYIPDLDQLEKLLSSRTKAVVINHPHNPTGSMLNRDELGRLVGICEKYGVYLISDEVYRDIVYSKDDIVSPAADLSGLAISIGDISKPFGLGGLRVGWLASQDERLLESCSILRDYTTMCCSVPAEFLATLALNNRAGIMTKKIKAAQRNLLLLESFIENNNDVLDWSKPRGGFTAFPRYKFSLDSRSFCEGLIRQGDTLLLPGSVFGVEHHFRIGFGGDTTVFSNGLAAFGRYIAKLRDDNEFRNKIKS